MEWPCSSNHLMECTNRWLLKLSLQLAVEIEAEIAKDRRMFLYCRNTKAWGSSSKKKSFLMAV